ncbi:hypothetical protein A6283_07695 [Bacillus wiedmannii]|uniref:hypothetical protein n=1 Tax=Bacillus wiedmannii TaxID=1890302 RepID=UPI0007DB4E92|nr:hypothetical protein [Bacillus wiedmannii]OAK23941.1 hypothetical protein A6283_07695 [Bacillus wiedmannii]PHB73569.1 hypothetical protein COE89_10340 [Bacillus wiedmannii]
MTIQKLHKVDRKESIFVFQGKISNWVRVALVEDTSWYCLQDVIDLLEVSGKACNIAPHISGENKRMLSFGARPTYVVDLKGIHEMTTMFEINDASLLTELVEGVSGVFNTRQEFVSMELDKEMSVPKISQEDVLALEVLNAENDEDRLVALAAYKDFLTQ